jgi:hypothetical protein
MTKLGTWKKKTREMTKEKPIEGFVECPKCKINYAICTCGSMPEEKPLSEIKKKYKVSPYIRGFEDGKKAVEEKYKEAVEKLKEEISNHFEFVEGNFIEKKIDSIFGRFDINEEIKKISMIKKLMRNLVRDAYDPAKDIK